MVPIRALAEARLVLGLQALTRYNNYRAAIINGAPAPGHSSGAALAAMERLSATPLPAGYSGSEEHTSELQSLMRISYAVFCLKKKHRVQDAASGDWTNFTLNTNTS